jgi:hypothetical protein
VQFDWERFGLGGPALDLAITVPGLGDMTSYLVVAGAYLACGPSDENHVPFRGTVEELARAIAYAKVWSVAEYLSEFVRSVGVQPAVRTPHSAYSIAARLPEWLASLG